MVMNMSKKIAELFCTSGNTTDAIDRYDSIGFVKLLPVLEVNGIILEDIDVI